MSRPNEQTKFVSEGRLHPLDGPPRAERARDIGRMGIDAAPMAPICEAEAVGAI